MITMIRRLFLLLIRSESLRYGVFPTSADGVAAAAITLTSGVAWTWGAWVQIVAAVGVAVETKVVGFTLENFVGIPAQGEVAIAIGGVGVEVEIARYTINGADVDLRDPIRVPPGTRLSAAYRNANAALDTVDIKLKTQTAF